MRDVGLCGQLRADDNTLSEKFRRTGARVQVLDVVDVFVEERERERGMLWSRALAVFFLAKMC